MNSIREEVLYTQSRDMVERIKALEAALLEAMRISRGMESREGIDNSRIQKWRSESHALLQPHASQSAKPGDA